MATPPHHSAVKETVLPPDEGVLKQSERSISLTTCGGGPMIILKILAVGTLAALLSTGVGAEAALAVLAII